MLSCKQVATAVASGELDSAGLRRRLGVWLHLMMCGHCRCYVRQIRDLGASARALLRRKSSDGHALASLEKRLIERCHEAPDHQPSGG